MQRRPSSALFLSPSLRCPAEKGRCGAGLEACPGQRCGRTARDTPVTTGLCAHLDTHVVCHCSPCLTLPSPGGQWMGTEGSAVTALPTLGSGQGSWGQENFTPDCGSLWTLVWGMVGDSSAAFPSSTPSPLFPSLSLIPSFHAHPPF